jgi:hypothetical protein
MTEKQESGLSSTLMLCTTLICFSNIGTTGAIIASILSLFILLALCEYHAKHHGKKDK